MDISKLKHRLESLRDKKKRIENYTDTEELIRENDELSVLYNSELRGIEEQIEYLEKRILEYQD